MGLEDKTYLAKTYGDTIGKASVTGYLEIYEKKYNMITFDFYKQFEAGVLGDENDFMLWAGVYELQLDTKNKLSQL